MKLDGRDYDNDMRKLACAIADLFPIYEGDFSSKRPFGNSNIEGDVAEIIGLEFPETEDSAEYKYVEQLYRDVGKWMKRQLKATA